MVLGGAAAFCWCGHDGPCGINDAQRTRANQGDWTIWTNIPALGGVKNNRTLGLCEDEQPGIDNIPTCELCSDLQDPT